MTIAVNKLLALVNRDNNTNIVDDQITLGLPLVNPDAGIARDTKITLSAVPGKGFRGAVTVWYNRIDLSILFKNVSANVGLEITEGMTTDALIPLINAKYGTDFEVSDFEAATPLVVEGGTATLTAKTDNVAYKGAFDVAYGLEEIALDSVVLVTTLTGFNYPNADITKGQAAIYSFNLDGSSQPDNFWGAVALGAVTADFVTPFNQAYRVDEDWIFDDAAGVDEVPAADYNLAGAEVIYNGDVSAAPAGHLVNTVYNKVVLMTLSATKCANFGGTLAVYHGGKVTPPPAPEEVGGQ